MQRCVVLGGAGFLGSALTRRLLQAGFEVCVIDRPKRSPPAGVPTLEFVGVESLSAGLFRRNVRPGDIVYHLWSDSGPERSNLRAVRDAANTILPTLWLLDHCARTGIRRLVFASSGGAVYGPAEPNPIDEDHPTEPGTAYGVAKLAIEKYLEIYRRLHGVDYVALRIANAYGPGLPVSGRQNAIGVFLRSAALQLPVHIWGSGQAVRDYVYGGDVIEALVQAAKLSPRRRVLNVGTSLGTSVLQLIAHIEAITNVRLARDWQPARVFDVSYNVLDCSRAASELNWRPRVTLDEGLRATWRWLQQSQASVPGTAADWGEDGIDQVFDEMRPSSPAY